MLDFAGVNAMYQTSLAQFCRLYDAAIAEAELSPVPARRVAAIAARLTAAVHAFVLRGLFEVDKLVFSATLAMRVAVDEGKVPAHEVDAFLRSAPLDGVGAGKKKPKAIVERGRVWLGVHGGSLFPPKPFPFHTHHLPKIICLQDWLPDDAWRSACRLAAAVPAAADLTDGLVRVEPMWKAWYEAPEPERAPLPELEGKVNRFQRVCVVKVRKSGCGGVSGRRTLSNLTHLPLHPQPTPSPTPGPASGPGAACGDGVHR